jgi:hypothetical protein
MSDVGCTISSLSLAVSQSESISVSMKARLATAAAFLGRLSPGSSSFPSSWSSTLPLVGSKRTIRHCSSVSGLAIMHSEWGDPEVECGVSRWCSGRGGGDGGVRRMSASTSRVVVATVLKAGRIRAGRNTALLRISVHRVYWLAIRMVLSVVIHGSYLYSSSAHNRWGQLDISGQWKGTINPFGGYWLHQNHMSAT